MLRLLGRDDAVPLAARFLSRSAGDHARPHRETPVLIFVGPGGSGKTVLLDALEHQLDQRVPHARIDCAKPAGRSVPDLVAALAFELARQGGPYGRLAFQRLIVGEVIIAEDNISKQKVSEGRLTVADREKARAEVRRVLDAYHDRAKLLAFLQQLSKSALPAIGGQVPPINTIAEALPGLIMDGLAAGRLGRRITLGKGQDWYGSRRGGTGTAALDELVDLNLRFREYEANRQWVDQLLLAAFLADLQDDFQHGKLAKSAFNCAILVDDADTAEGRHFVTEFARACESHTGHTGMVAPVTVIATSRGALAAQVLPDAGSYPPLARADAEDALRDPETRWYPVSLPDLTERDVRVMASEMDLPAGHVPAMIYKFTGGHPRSTRCLLAAIAEHPRDPVDIGRLLDGPHDPGDRSRTVGEQLLDDLLIGFSSRQRDQLVTIAAARNREEAERLSAPKGLLATHDAATILTADLWQAGDPRRPAALPPVLHRLLARRLARRDEDETADWETVHRRLRPAAAWGRLAEEDKVRDLYHALALGELRPVTRRLAAWLVELDAATWLALVKAVVVAPRRSPAGGEPAIDAENLAKAVGQADPDDGAGQDLPSLRALAALTAGLWIAADPFTGESRRDLHLGIAAGYDAAAQFSPEGRAVLHAEAAQHRTEALRWPA
jgi:hypothetical protein